MQNTKCEFIHFEFFLEALSSNNATAGRFFVSFFFCQKNEQKKR